jgi:hypothetical protein
MFDIGCPHRSRNGQPRPGANLASPYGTVNDPRHVHSQHVDVHSQQYGACCAATRPASTLGIDDRRRLSLQRIIVRRTLSGFVRARRDCGRQTAEPRTVEGAAA